MVQIASDGIIRIQVVIDIFKCVNLLIIMIVDKLYIEYYKKRGCHLAAPLVFP